MAVAHKVEYIKPKIIYDKRPILSIVIAYYNGSAGGTKNTIDYAKKHNIQVVEPDGITEE